MTKKSASGRSLQGSSSKPVMRFIYELEGEQKEFEIAKTSFVIGRKPECDFYIPDASVSKQHVQCKYEGGELVVRDLGSSNGTKINGRKIVENFLSDRDVLEVGTIKLLFILEGGEEKAKRAAEIGVAGKTTELQLSLRAPKYKKKYTFSPQKITIGSHEENNIVLKESGVSRFHSELYATPDGAWILRDLGSRNGTLVGGLSINSQPLTSGDTFQVGPVFFDVKTKIVEAGTSHGESSLPPALQNPIVLALVGLVFLLLVASLFMPSPPEKKPGGQVSSPEGAYPFHQKIEEGIGLFERDQWEESKKVFKTLVSKYQNSEMAQNLLNLMSLRLDLNAHPFSFDRWKEFRVEIDRLTLTAAVYEKKWKDVSRFSKFYKNFKTQMDRDQSGRDLFLEGQNLFKAGNFEASYRKFEEISPWSIFWQKAEAFKKKHRIVQQIVHKYMQDARDMEDIAYQEQSPVKYIAAKEILQRLLKKYPKVLRDLEKEVLEKMDKCDRNREALEDYMKARDYLMKEKNFEKAIEYAQKVSPTSRYWEGENGAKRIVIFSKANLRFSKAQKLWEQGAGEEARKILNELDFKESRALKAHIQKILDMVQKARNAEKQDNLYMAREYLKKIYRAEKNPKNKYGQQAYQNYVRLERKMHKAAKSYYEIGMNSFGEGHYRAALEYFEKTQQCDLKGEYLPSIQNFIREKDQSLFEKAKNLQFSSYLFNWKNAKAIHQILIKFLPQDNPIRKKSQEKIAPLREKIKLRERQEERLKKSNGTGG